MTDAETIADLLQRLATQTRDLARTRAKLADAADVLKLLATVGVPSDPPASLATACLKRIYGP